MGGVAFAVGTGRCGTKFLAELLAQDPAIASHHERHPFSDTFHRYCKWYNIPVDEAGFIAVKRRGIEEDLRTHAFSFEASAFLSLSLETLHNRLGARSIIMLRRPDRVVTSYLRRDWYATEPNVDDPRLPPSMQDVRSPHHFLGRTMPIGEEFERWRGLTRVGKIGWFWSRLNRALLEQAARLPSDAATVQKIETLDYANYQRLMQFVGAPAHLAESDFQAVKRRRPNGSSGEWTPHDWSALEAREFEHEVRDLAEQLGYCWKVEELTREPRPLRPKPFLRGLVRPLWERQASAQS